MGERFEARLRAGVRYKDEHLKRVVEGAAFLVFDGAMGTQLQARGLAAGALPELLCFTAPDVVTDVHRAYVEAGAQVVTTNTFGANAHKLGEAATVEDTFAAAVACARASGARYVAADIGPTGSLLQPMGTLSFDEAYELFAQQVKAAAAAGADLFVIETMADLLEMKAAVLAAKDFSDLPIFATMTFGEDGRTFLGTTPEVAAVTLSALGADVVGVNCSLGPDEVAPLVERMLLWADCPVMVQANAGLPQVTDGQTTYSIMPHEYCAAVARMVDAGVTVVGGCCGTSPEYTCGEVELLGTRVPRPRELAHWESAEQWESLAGPARHVRDDFCVTSAQRMAAVPAGHVAVIGERINPTGKRRMKEALRTQNLDYVVGEAIDQDAAGADILDVNAGLPEINEAEMLVRMVNELQGVTTCPLQIDSATPEVIEAAVRVYPGKPIINSTNGRADVLERVVPIAKKYGCALVGLTIDEQGIPTDAQGRLAIARKIVAATDAAGIPRRDVAIDCLCMAASTDQRAPREILESIRLVKRELPGVRCVLGVSNVSFGLPAREVLNAAFLSAAFGAGLDLAIMNPLSPAYKDVVAAWRVLVGQDEGARDFVAEYANRPAASAAPVVPAVVPSGSAPAASSTPATTGQSTEAAGTNGEPNAPCSVVRELVLAGRKGPVGPATASIVSERGAMFAINEVLIPALDEVGERFERGVFFLPQLMASAEAAKEGFEAIRALSGGEAVASKGTVVLAVVRGDIHDIGKNIVKMLLENYGYEVVDLGRDVEPQRVVDAVREHDVRLVGLSALMTTTIGAMAETIQALRDSVPHCKVVVGGAVLNPEYAQMVGADYYAKDAAETARIAAEVLG